MKTHTKGTDTFQFLDRTSGHPESVFKGFIKGETIRYTRTSNNLPDFITKRTMFHEKLINRGYNHTEINKFSLSTEHSDREKYLEKRDKLRMVKNIFTTIYNPYISHHRLKAALTKHWDIIKRDPSLDKLFQKPPLVAYKRHRNLKEKITKAVLTKDETTTLMAPTQDRKSASCINGDVTKSDNNTNIPSNEDLIRILTSLENE